MPESVESPAPVSTTSGRVASRSRAPRPRRVHLGGSAPRRGEGVRRTAQRHVPYRSRALRAGLLRLDLAVLRRRRRHQVVEQVLGDVGDLLHRGVEHRLVGLRRLGRPGDLADVLQRGGRHLVTRRGRLEVVQRADVAAHAPSVRRASGARQRSTSGSKKRDVLAGHQRDLARRERHEPDLRDVAAVLDLDHPVGHRAVVEREHRDPAGGAAPALGDDGQRDALLGQPGELARVVGRAGVGLRS